MRLRVVADAAPLAAALAVRRSPLCRRMIVVEGVYANFGDVAPLQQLYCLKEQYK